MEKIVLQTNGQKYPGLYWKGKKNNDIAIIYFHGLNGRAKLIKPLLKELDDFDIYSMEQRGHINSFQKSSVRPKKHTKDIKLIVDQLKGKYKKIYLCGESMGGLYCSLYGYLYDNVDHIFSWSIPFFPKNIMIENKKKKLIIFTRIFLCFLFGWNYSYRAKIDYPKLTNSKFLMKMHELDIDTTGSTSEEISIWKGSIKIKWLFINKKPKIKISYWQGDKDIMSSNKLIKRFIKKNNIKAKEIKNAKHILMFEEGFNSICQNIKETILQDINNK